MGNKILKMSPNAVMGFRDMGSNTSLSLQKEDPDLPYFGKTLEKVYKSFGSKTWSARNYEGTLKSKKCLKNWVPLDASGTCSECSVLLKSRELKMRIRRSQTNITKEANVTDGKESYSQRSYGIEIII